MVGVRGLACASLHGGGMAGKSGWISGKSRDCAW